MTGIQMKVPNEQKLIIGLTKSALFDLLFYCSFFHAMRAWIEVIDISSKQDLSILRVWVAMFQKCLTGQLHEALG